VFGWLGPVVLLVSALLTAGYLLPVTIRGFFPGNGFDYGNLQKREPEAAMLLPILILTSVSVLAGMFPAALVRFLGGMLW
jgi:multicomponent Na+:H+ antiporter subunit D